MTGIQRTTHATIIAGVGALLALALGGLGHAQDVDVRWEVIVEGLDGPRGIHAQDPHTLYLAEAGRGGEQCYAGPMEEYGGAEFCAGDTGAVTRVTSGDASTVASGLPSIVSEGAVVGPQDVAFGEDGALFATVGSNGSHEELGRYGRLVRIDAGGAVDPVADLLAFERERHPGQEVIASNPYSLVRSPEGDFIVADAAMNALLRVSPEGDVSIVAEFEDRTAEVPPEARGEDGPNEVSMDSVPTGLAIGPEGNYYVGELTGFPFPVGEARVWRVTPDGEARTYADGFTNIIDLAFDSSGRLYLLEMLSGGLLHFDPEDPDTMGGALIRLGEGGTRTTIASDRLSFPTGLTIDANDTIYVSNAGAAPGGGELVRIELSGEDSNPSTVKRSDRSAAGLVK